MNRRWTDSARYRCLSIHSIPYTISGRINKIKICIWRILITSTVHKFPFINRTSSRTKIQVDPLPQLSSTLSPVKTGKQKRHTLNMLITIRQFPSHVVSNFAITRPGAVAALSIAHVASTWIYWDFVTDECWPVRVDPQKAPPFSIS